MRSATLIGSSGSGCIDDGNGRKAKRKKESQIRFHGLQPRFIDFERSDVIWVGTQPLEYSSLSGLKVRRASYFSCMQVKSP